MTGRPVTGPVLTPQRLEELAQLIATGIDACAGSRYEERITARAALAALVESHRQQGERLEAFEGGEAFGIMQEDWKQACDERDNAWHRIGVLEAALREAEKVAAEHEGVTPEAYELITDVIRAVLTGGPQEVTERPKIADFFGGSIFDVPATGLLKERDDAVAGLRVAEKALREIANVNTDNPIRDAAEHRVIAQAALASLGALVDG